jgi:type II secretory pathway pseudopilin PulG
LKIRFKNRASGFSLVELLLTLVLILCLAAASVFTFTSIYRSANLDEGYDRFQSLIRFAQAEAATTGRKVRLNFVPAHAGPAANSIEEPAVVEEEPSDLRSIQVTWEADLLNAPGVFQAYTNKSWSEDMVNELVGVAKVQPVAQAAHSPTAENAAAAPEEQPAGANSELPEFPCITFYPDGSCDSAEIVLVSRNDDDDRRLAVHLSGIFGSVSSRTLSPSETEDDPFEEFDAAGDGTGWSTGPATLAQQTIFE